MYLDEIAEMIRANIPEERIPGGDIGELLRIYAVLVRAKGSNVTSSDIHDAWAAWVVTRDGNHASLVPFGSLTREVQQQDIVFLAALKHAATELGYTGDSRSEFEEVLFSSGPPKGESEVRESLELYKIIVTSSEALVARRLGVNTFFLTMNGALVTAMGIIFQNSRGDRIAGFGVALMAVVGVILCFAWGSLITSFGQLNRGKFKVIHSLERCLKASIYTAEWEALERGENPKVYRSFTSKEKWVPNSLIGLYSIASILALAFGLGFLSLSR